MIIGDMEIRLRADIARLQRDMDSARQVVGNATAGMERAANAAKTALASIAAGLGVQELGRMVDEYAKFTAQLKLASLSQREYAAAYADVKRISTQSTQGLQETGVLYARIANGTRELGTAQRQVAAITETVNLSLLVSGATASEAASAQMQLSQAFASGTLRGEEFNAVNEAAPRLMLALADGIGVPVGALKKMAEEGQITSKIMADVLPNALVKLRQEAKEVQTISGAFTVLRNNMMEFVGVQANASGVVSALTQAITGLSDNLATVGTAIVAITAMKLAFWLDAVATKTLAASIASTTHRNATAASAQATVASTAAEVRNLQARAAMIVELRAETMATLAATNAVINSTASDAAKTLAMQSRSVASAELAALGRAQVTVDAALVTSTGAAAAATTAMTATTWRAAIAARALAAATWAIANPLASITLALGVGATAWMWWSSRAQEANDKVAASTDETTTEMIGRLDKQIEKLKERNKLQSEEPRVQKLGQLSDADEQGLARAKAALDAVRSGSGQWANEPLFKRQLAEIDLANEYETALLRLQQAQNELGAAATRTRDARIGDWYAQNGNNAQKLSAELDKLRQQFGTIPPEMEKMVRAKYADKGSAQAVKQEATAYQNLITSIREKSAANALELQGYNTLSESQKMAIKLDAEIGTGKNKLSAESVSQARAEIALLEVQEQAIEAKQQSAKWAEVEAKNDSDHYDSLRAGTAAIDDQIKQYEKQIETYGLSASAAIDMEKAKLEAKLAAGPATYAELIALDEQIAKMGKLADLARNKEVMEASSEAAKKATEDWKRASEQIGQSLTDNLMRGGKSAAEYIKDLFRTLVLRPIVQPIGNAVGNSINSAMGMPGGTSPGSTSPGVAESVSRIYDTFKKGGSMEQSIAQGVQKGFDAAGLSQSGGTPGTAAQFAGRLGGTVAGYMAGDALNKTISGGFETGSGFMKVEKVATAVGSYIAGPIGGMVVGAISGVINRAFGMKERENKGTTLNGSFGGAGFTGSTDTAWSQKGGWFRSDKSGVDKVGVDATAAKQFAAAYDAIKSASADFASVLGLNAEAIKNRSQSMSIALTNDEAANQATVAAFFVGVGNTIAGELLPSLSAFQRDGEAASGTLERLAVGYALVDTALNSIGMSFGAVGVSSLEARERLLAASGGLDAFAANTAAFQQNFLSEAERNAPVLKSVTEQLAALGLAGVDTRDEFKQVVLGLDLTSAAGAKQYGALMNLQAGFAQVYPVMEAAADAAAALAEANRPYLEQIRQIELSMMSAADRRSAEIAGMDSSTVALYDRLAALRLESSALEASTAATQAATQAVRDAATSLLAGVDSSFSVLQSIVSREKAAVQSSIDAHTESVSKLQSLSQALRGTLDSIQSPDQKLAARANGQAQISAALAIARAGGPLPGADSLKSALSAVQQDASDQFSSYTDYLRDLYRTQNDLGALAGLTDAQLSVEEKALQATRDQLAALEAQLASTQALIDEAKGQTTTLLSIDQGIAGVRAAILAAQSNPVVAATSAINSAYQQHLGRAPDAAGFEWWKDAAASGTPVSQIVSGIAGSAEADLNKLYQSVLGRAPDAEGLAFWMKAYGPTMDAAEKADFLKAAQPELQGKKIPGFANGGDFGGGVRAVGEVGVEIEATGPSRIHSTQSLMDAIRRPPSNSNDALAAAVERLSATVDRQNAVIERQGAALEQIQRNTRRQADTLDVVTEGGNGMRVTT